MKIYQCPVTSCTVIQVFEDKLSLLCEALATQSMQILINAVKVIGVRVYCVAVF